MGMKMDVSKLKVDLDKLRERMRLQATRKAVVAAAEVIGAAMISRTPVQVEKKAKSHSLEPGEVKASIRVRSKISKAGNPYALVGPNGSETSKVAHLVEYGHRMVVGGSSRLTATGKFEGKGRVLEKDVPPHAFLRPAYEESAAEAGEVLVATIAKEMEKI